MKKQACHSTSSEAPISELDTALVTSALFEEEFGLKRTATHGGAFFGRPERSTYQFNPYVYGGTRPSKKYALNLFVSKGFNSFDFDFGAEPKYPRVSPAALAESLGSSRSRSWDLFRS